jgi:hypothetical protein
VAAILSPEVDRAWPAAWTPAGRIVLPVVEPAGATHDLAFTALASAVALQTLALAVIHASGRNPDLIGRENPDHQASADLANRPLPGA